jgi:hypothetical protein
MAEPSSPFVEVGAQRVLVVVVVVVRLVVGARQRWWWGVVDVQPGGGGFPSARDVVDIHMQDHMQIFSRESYSRFCLQLTFVVSCLAMF